MAKSNSTIKTVSMIVGFLVIFASVIIGSTTVAKDVEANSEDIREIRIGAKETKDKLSEMAGDVKAIRAIMEHQLKETPK